MNNFLQRIKRLPSYLTFQIFASFWLSFAILLAIALALPHLDTRSFNSLRPAQREFFEERGYYVMTNFDIDESFQKGKTISTSSGMDVVLLEPHTGIMRGASEDQLRHLQQFMFTADDPTHPLSRRFGTTQISGPFMVHTGKNVYYEYFIQTVSKQTEIVSFIFDSPWIMFLLLLVISTPLLALLSLHLTRSLHMLRTSTNAVIMGDYSLNNALETEGFYEIQRLGQSFNTMIRSLQTLLSNQQRLLSDISHELKTPLTRLHLASSIIRRRYGETNELLRIEKEIELLNVMINDLLSLSRQDVNQHLKRQIFPINHIWENIFDDAKFETEQNGIQLVINQLIAYPDAYLINGSPTNLASAVENLIRNAQKYAKSKIRVTTYTDKADLYIFVDDDGIGVSEHEYEQIFLPFYRVDEARARETGGTGLGLTIVANAVKKHNGIVQAQKSPLGGLRVQIILPLWHE